MARTFQVTIALKVVGNIPNSVFMRMARLGGSSYSVGGDWVFNVPLDKLEDAKSVLQGALFTEVK